jgi:hypothetical protein
VLTTLVPHLASTGLLIVAGVLALPIVVISLLLPVVVVVALWGGPERGRRARQILGDLLTALGALLRAGRR